MFVTLCNLRPHHSVLEPGCGCGRNARYIAPLLDPESGSFAGFDVSKSMIQWCKNHISSAYPNCSFDHADIRNSHYNPKGSIEDDEYRFPYRDNQFDIVFMPSVFTHITRTGFEHYLSEICRVLKKDGRLLSWHFLLDIDNPHKGGKRSKSVVKYDDVSWTSVSRNPAAFMIYDAQYVLHALDIAGFAVQAKLIGDWDGGRSSGIDDFQDRILSTKR